MKFRCICLSPAIDVNVRLMSAPKGDGEVFKNVEVVENVGGKAINVARWLAIRGAEVVCAGFLGEDNAFAFEKEFSKYGIADGMSRVEGSTRRNEMITWPGGSFKLNQAAFPRLQPCGVESFVGDVSSDDVVVVSGSLPKNFPISYYADLIRAFAAKGCRTVLDASGEALKLGIEAMPDMIKPNAEECESVMGFIPKMPSEFKRATEMLRRKVGHVVISDGSRGCWFDGEFVPAPQVDVVDTTSAGDTLLAEYCFSNDASLAVAAGSAAVMMKGSMPPSFEQVKELVGR